MSKKICLTLLVAFNLSGYSQLPAFQLTYQRVVQTKPLDNSMEVIYEIDPASVDSTIDFVIGEVEEVEQPMQESKKVVDELQIELLEKSNFVITKGSDKFTRYYDFGTGEIYHSGQDIAFSRLPLIAELAGRVAEFENRKSLQKIMGSASIGGAVFGDQANLESLFGIKSFSSNVGNQITSKNEGDTLVYTYKTKDTSRVVAKIILSTTEVPKKNKGAFQKFLIYETHLHPKIIQELVGINKIPEFIEYSIVNTGNTLTQLTLKKFENSLYTVVLPSLPTHLKSSTDSLLSHNYLTIKSTNLPKIKGKAYFLESDRLKQEGKMLDALLALFEYLLTTGEQPIDKITPLVQMSGMDPDLMVFLDALKEKKPKSLPNDKINTQERLIKKHQAYAPILQIFLANDYTKLDEEKAIDLMVSALTKKPLIAGAWGDLGKIFESRYDLNRAWLCYEIAIAISPKHPLLTSVLNRKAFLEEVYPNYF